MVMQGRESLNLDNMHLCYFVGALPVGIAG